VLGKCATLDPGVDDDVVATGMDVNGLDDAVLLELDDEVVAVVVVAAEVLDMVVEEVAGVGGGVVVADVGRGGGAPRRRSRNEKLAPLDDEPDDVGPTAGERLPGGGVPDVVGLFVDTLLVDDPAVDVTDDAVVVLDDGDRVDGIFTGVGAN
jgi:hypothetical protein